MAREGDRTFTSFMEDMDICCLCCKGWGVVGARMQCRVISNMLFYESSFFLDAECRKYRPRSVPMVVPSVT